MPVRAVLNDTFYIRTCLEIEVHEEFLRMVLTYRINIIIKNLRRNRL